ncbi:DMT family transporter [Phaeovulum sp.]|uniref:DMT family transporter n=1 Tax=Phaeovulum sp. TaxID=2934796 RepID=UPI003520AF15
MNAIAATAKATRRPDRPVAGVLWMLVTGLNFVAVTGIVRYLGPELPAAQSAFIRFAFGVAFLAPTLALTLQRGFAPGALRLFAARGALHTVAVILWFYAMARIPVAEVTAIGYLNPVVVTIGAALFFGERLAARRILAIGVAIGGALIVLRPGLREIEPGHWSQLFAALFFGLSYLIAKRLSEIAPAGAVVAMMALTVTIGLAPFALWVWVPVSLVQVAWLGLVAVFATAGHYCMTRAFACAPLTVTQPVTFLQLVWATLLGALMFGEAVDPMVMLGGALIIGAISYITWREAQIKRRTTPAVPPV